MSMFGSAHKSKQKDEKKNSTRRIFSLVNSQASADTDTELSIQASVVGVIRARAAEAAEKRRKLLRTPIRGK